MTNDKMNETIMQALIIVFLFVFGFVLGMILVGYTAFVLTYLWEWFVLPVFTGVAPLTILQAMGIILLVNLVLPCEKNLQDNKVFFNHAIVRPSLILLIGFIIKSML